MLDNPTAISVFKWSFSALLILPQSILLGMTLPLMSTGIVRALPETQGQPLAMLYFTNSLGAAAGVLVSGFYLVPLMGLPGAMYTAGVINIVLAAVVWLAVRATPGVAPAPVPRSESSESNLGRLFLFAAFITGFASFCYEIGWIHMLSMVLGSTVQSFEMMLSAFITGLAFGGLSIRKRIDRMTDPIGFSGYVQLLMGLFALLTIALYNQLFDFMSGLMGAVARTDGGYALFNLGSHALALLVMLPATFMAGMTLPLFTSVLIRRGVGEGSIGRIYAANTLGAIAGVMVAIHLALPNVGTKGLIGIGAFLDIALGLGLLSMVYRGDQRRKLALVGTLAVALFIGIYTSSDFDWRRTASGVYRDGISAHSEEDVSLYHRDGKTATVDLIRMPGGVVVIKTNGKADAGINLYGEEASTDEITQVMLGLMPLLLNPETKNVAQIGFGSGMTSHVALSVPTVTRVDSIEIEEVMVEAARIFGPLAERPFTDPRSRILIEDAKTFFSTRQTKYDAIISGPSNPWVSGVASLFTQEFYQHVDHYLADGGVLIQWLQLYETNMDLISSVMAALGPKFTDYQIFNTDQTNMLIIARKGRALGELDASVFASPDLQVSLERVGLRDLSDLERLRIGDKASLQPLFDSYGSQPNSDYYPYLAFRAPRARYLVQMATELSALRTAPVPVLALLDGRERLRPAQGNALPTDPSERLARQLYDRLMNPQEEVNIEGISGRYRHLLSMITLQHAQCTGGDLAQQVLLEDLYTLSELTTAFLDQGRNVKL